MLPREVCITLHIPCLLPQNGSRLLVPNVYFGLANEILPTARLSLINLGSDEVSWAFSALFSFVKYAVKQ